MADIIITVVSGETVDLGLSIPGVQGPIGIDTVPSGGVAGNILVKQSSLDYDSAWAMEASGLALTASTISDCNILNGTISGVTLSGTIVDSTINAPAISGGTIESSIVSFATINTPTISGAIIEASALIGGTISGVTLSGTIVNSTINTPVISGGTMEDTVLSSVSIASSTVSGGTVFNPTLSGSASTGSGFVLGGASDLLAFFGSSAVVQPSGIVIPSGGSSVDEVGTVVSGIIIALQNLGLLGA